MGSAANCQTTERINSTIFNLFFSSSIVKWERKAVFFFSSFIKLQLTGKDTHANEHVDPKLLSLSIRIIKKLDWIQFTNFFFFFFFCIKIPFGHFWVEIRVCRVYTSKKLSADAMFKNEISPSKSKFVFEKKNYSS